MKNIEFDTSKGVPATEEEKLNNIDDYSLRIVDDIQDDYEYGAMYLIGSSNIFWRCVFHCPCGCGELLELLLLDGASPNWTAELIDDSHVDLSPSIWKTHGCKSHFFIKNNRVLWVPQKRNIHIYNGIREKESAYLNDNEGLVDNNQHNR